MDEARLTVVAGIIAGVLGCRPQDVPADAPVGSLPQWDSIAHLSIVLAFEEKLGRQLTPDEIAALKTVASLADLLPSEAGTPA
ncbi:acyl carrier protein [Mesorhizobium sp. VNQ89]|uniref:acyl carrier protein n=1 Tax=Mesorhizobium quangtriensis TaxID=3157709 RepID=UPI0032B7F99C